MEARSIAEEVLTAFGIDPNVPLKALPGGSLVCYLAGNDIVLRPSEDGVESEQIAQILIKLAQVMSPGAPYRISRPIPVAGDPTRYVSHGWTALSFLSGSPRDEVDWDETLRTCRAFHRDIGEINIGKPEFLNRRMNRFREADLVAWDEKRLDELPSVKHVNVLSRISQPLRQLGALKRDFTGDMPSQLVHGDIGGNMLFAQDGRQPPGIIDMTFYWRPAGYGAAIVVADGLLWHGEGEGLVRMYGTDADSIQVLVRALLFRIVTWAIDVPVVGADSDTAWAERMLPVVDFVGAVDVVSAFVDAA